MKMSTPELKLALIAKEITETKWYEFLKRRRLHKKAVEFAKENNIDY